LIAAVWITAGFYCHFGWGTSRDDLGTVWTLVAISAGTTVFMAAFGKIFFPEIFDGQN
jgi:hypothetical protein